MSVAGPLPPTRNSGTRACQRVMKRTPPDRGGSRPFGFRPLFGAGLLRKSDGAGAGPRGLSGSDEHKMLRDMCRAFADTELAPNAGKWDKAHEFPVDAIKQMSEMGLMGVAQPTDYGGAGSRPCLPSACTCPAVDLRAPHASARFGSGHSTGAAQLHRSCPF